MSTETPPTPVQAEAEGTPIKIEWEGNTIDLPPSFDDMDVETIEALESGKVITGVKGILGAKRYDEILAKFKRDHGRKMTVRDFATLGDKVTEAYGLTQGE